MGSGISSSIRPAQVFHRKKNKQNTEKSHHVTLKSPWTCHPRSQFRKLPDYVDSSRDRDRIFIPKCWVVGPLYQLSKKGSRFHSTHPPKKVTNSQNCQVVLTFCLKKKWLEITKHPSIHPSIHPLKKMVLTRVPETSLSLSQKETGLFLITLSVEILNSIKKKSQRLPGHSAGYFGELPKLPTNKNPEQSVIFTVDSLTFFEQKMAAAFSSVPFFEDVSNPWGGLLQPGQVVFQWISQKNLPAGSSWNRCWFTIQGIGKNQVLPSDLCSRVVLKDLEPGLSRDLHLGD